jgi:hypothetical protein
VLQSILSSKECGHSGNVEWQLSLAAHPHAVVALRVVLHKGAQDVGRLTVAAEPPQAQGHVHAGPLVVWLQQAHQPHHTQGLLLVPLEAVLWDLRGGEGKEGRMNQGDSS